MTREQFEEKFMESLARGEKPQMPTKKKPVIEIWNELRPGFMTNAVSGLTITVDEFELYRDQDGAGGLIIKRL